MADEFSDANITVMTSDGVIHKVPVEIARKINVLNDLISDLGHDVGEIPMNMRAPVFDVLLAYYKSPPDHARDLPDVPQMSVVPELTDYDPEKDDGSYTIFVDEDEEYGPKGAKYFIHPTSTMEIYDSYDTWKYKSKFKEAWRKYMNSSLTPSEVEFCEKHFPPEFSAALLDSASLKSGNLTTLQIEQQRALLFFYLELSQGCQMVNDENLRHYFGKRLSHHFLGNVSESTVIKIFPKSHYDQLCSFDDPTVFFPKPLKLRAM